jgi:hypothetical protein
MITPTFGKLKRGDIVTIYAPRDIDDQDHSLVKRVVAVESCSSISAESWS